jgi:hypothetical protein
VRDKPPASSRTDIAERRTAPSCTEASRIDEQVIDLLRRHREMSRNVRPVRRQAAGTGLHPASEEAVASGADFGSAGDTVVAALPQLSRPSAAPGGRGR